jgi:hypothetical protein
MFFNEKDEYDMRKKKRSKYNSKGRVKKKYKEERKPYNCIKIILFHAKN